MLPMQAFRQRFLKKTADAPRILSKIDYYRLQTILTHQQELAYQKRLKRMVKLRQLLLRARVCPCKEVPGDLVTMNSVLRVQSERGSEFTITLVYPRDADRKERKYSVLSGLGLELIGKRVGERFLESMQIIDILYQPESTGKFYI
ncbi:MAG: GreA/GreB family elongation factor [Planctomycetaceae bacterium]|nr:GreA/GreB family elongation factor [Planctomycetaceae bacterium]